MERDARYATVALFAIACIAAAVAFIWWYSGRGDRRDYQAYEIYFEGSVSGLSKGSPVRYLGVDVGRVTSLSIDREDPGRVKVVAEIDAMAPVSGATQAKLGLLGLTGLLYIDLQQDPKAPVTRLLPTGERYPVIASRKGTIEASVERLPQILTQASDILGRVELLLADDNVRSFGATLANLEQATAQLPATLEDAQALAADLRRISATTLELTTRVNQTLEATQPDLHATLANARVTSEKLARTADAIERLLSNSDGTFGRSARASVAELQQLVIDARGASNEFRELARELRERPSSLLLERADAGVELPR
ncbi:MAG TPA: MlaD family protein [Steroidobacteraceae bacterium]|nr:MlaD family protein [Steroidobacteraceae bacterium]